MAKTIVKLTIETTELHLGGQYVAGVARQKTIQALCTTDG